MKFLYLSFSVLFLLILSCKNDDENSGPPPIPEDEKLIETIIADGLNYEFKYNEDKTVSSLNVSNYFIFDYAYESGRVSAISFLSAEGQYLEYILEYDNNNRISSFSVDDIVTPVVYNAGGNYYLYQKENGDEFTLFLNENGDIDKVTAYDNEYDETENVIYLYEESGKGVLTNTNVITVPTILVLGEPFLSYYLFPVSKKPLENMAITGGGLLTFENEYDEQGFITQSIVQSALSEEPTVVIYNYMQL